MKGMNRNKLPIGIEDFEKIRTEGFYYVDKTGLIAELLHSWGEVNLFTRPRRFGKSLNMSMLKCFFQPDGDKGIFDGLQIAGETALCEKYMGKFPVIAVSLKSIHASSFETAREMAAGVINEEAGNHPYLSGSARLTQQDQETYVRLMNREMSEAALSSSLRDLSRLLHRHYGRKVIILIDEYDVPLAKAFDNGYYEQMVILIRNMLEQALKTNDSLYFAVLTGCLRIAKESIFTGLNNLNVLSIADVQFDEYFGFTDQEVRELLDYYERSEFYDVIKEWYDGYQFGKIDVYCPWDVICHCGRLWADAGAQPRSYWTNTGSRDVIRHFIEKSDTGTAKQDMERLVAGEAVPKKIHMELTYRDLYSSMDNLWSVLFTTGYLTQRGRPQGDVFWLVIPNMEIRNVFTEQIMEYFKETLQRDGRGVNQFCEALKNGDAAGAQEQFGRYLKKAVSIRDTFVKKRMKENYYHGILMGLLAFKETWAVRSNQETGSGYSDILVEIADEEIGIVIEVKYPDGGSLEEGCLEALRQIERNDYEERLVEDGMQTILKYGVACYKKKCRIMTLTGN